MGEACDLGRDPVSGARITRLTSAVMTNVNIYCEQPYTSADGRRIAVVRSPEADPREGPRIVSAESSPRAGLDTRRLPLRRPVTGTVGVSGEIV